MPRDEISKVVCAPMAVGSVSARNGIAEEIGQNVNGSVEPVFLFGREDDQEDAINHCGNLMRRIANIIGIVLLVVVVIGVAIYASIPDRSPPEGFKLVVCGMALAHAVAILGSEPTQRSLPALDIDCTVWESPKGMVVVVLDDGFVQEAHWLPARQESEFVLAWRWLVTPR